MSNTVTANLNEGVWCLHVLTNHAVPGPSQMDPVDPTGHGTSTDVNLTFSVSTLSESPSVVDKEGPIAFAVPWSKAEIQPGDAYDDKAHRGTYWARIFPAAFEDHVFVQLAQVGYQVGYQLHDVPFRLFNGRLQTRMPLQFFGHGAGNDGGQNLSFTLTQGECPKPPSSGI